MKHHLGNCPTGDRCICDAAESLAEISQAQLDWETVKAMRVWGGGFIKQLAVTYLHADNNNQKRIKDAFPEYWHQYAEMARQQREENGPKWFDFEKP